MRLALTCMVGSCGYTYVCNSAWEPDQCVLLKAILSVKPYQARPGYKYKIALFRAIRLVSNLPYFVRQSISIKGACRLHKLLKYESRTSDTCAVPVEDMSVNQKRLL